MSLYDMRDSGDRTPYSIVVDLGEGANLAGAETTFTLSTLDLLTRKINAGAAQVTDITDQVGASPPLSVWRLSYEPTADEAAVEESTDFVGKWAITFAGNKPRLYPKGEFMGVSINRA